MGLINWKFEKRMSHVSVHMKWFIAVNVHVHLVQHVGFLVSYCLQLQAYFMLARTFQTKWTEQVGLATTL
jgi:hypothetical protein